ncbi:inactive polyglycylase TTLL10 [Hippopotamus amphibius kiboko]|uniref:inactive polyglycylase TTLL10 n=1 Tax=Hippopotamus amphibius kiboko TaxID=575201 RepID=UPI002599B63A|nr:inactive polyglycylase TTLL10 [Hippopotamus amphibius kiboko]
MGDSARSRQSRPCTAATAGGGAGSQGVRSSLCPVSLRGRGPEGPPVGQQGSGRDPSLVRRGGAQRRDRSRCLAAPAASSHAPPRPLRKLPALVSVQPGPAGELGEAGAGMRAGPEPAREPGPRRLFPALPGAASIVPSRSQNLPPRPGEPPTARVDSGSSVWSLRPGRRAAGLPGRQAARLRCGQVRPKPDLGARAADQGLTGWARERSMGSCREEELLHQLRQLDRDAAGLGQGPGGAEKPQAGPEPLTAHLPAELDDADAARPRAALLEKYPLQGEKQPPSPGQGPFFYIGGTNGASIINSYCKTKGWQRIQDSRREDYKLKWCEVKCRDAYCSFREGEQLLYQLPNNKLLTTKIGLLSALRKHARALGKTSKPGPCAQAKVLKMEDFFPETYRLDIRDEREAFFTLFDETQMWICKPTASNQGKGIFLLRNQEEVAALQAKTQSSEDNPVYRKMPFRAPPARVVQRYIQNPLLLDGKKFDVRSYLLIACTTPYMVFFGHGYARLTLGLYDPHSRDLSGHLTNQFVQKKSPLYVLLKEDTVWSMEHLNRYINDKFRKTKGLPQDWVFTTFTKRMQQIMAHCFLAVKSKLECKLGYFDLIGCDFLIDENFKVWLLEMNSNPALHTNCEVLKEVIPGVVMETLDLALETFQKSLRSRKMLPLSSQRRFVLLHEGEADPRPRPGASRSAPRPPPPPPPPRAARRPGPGGAQGGDPAAPEGGRPRVGGEDAAREPSPAPAEEGRENAGRRGS